MVYPVIELGEETSVIFSKNTGDVWNMAEEFLYKVGSVEPIIEIQTIELQISHFPM